jgi:DNA-binding CsgD family transcriptional regulator
MRVWLAVRDRDAKAALVRALRNDSTIRLVSTEEEADIVCRDADPEQTSLRVTTTEGLTPRELDVLGLVANGLDNRAIGEELGITRSTVKHHLAAVFAKLGVHGRAGAVKEGMRRGVVPL